MKLICADQQLISTFKYKNSLLDAVTEKIEIFSVENFVDVKIWLVMRRSSDFDKVLLHFANCKEYLFLYTGGYNFCNVERVKLFQTEDGLFYASFDPFDELKTVSDNDQDFVLARNIYAYIA